MASLLISGGLTTILMILWVAVPTPSVLLTNRAGRLGVISLLAQPAVASLLTELVGWPPLWPCQARLWLPTAIEVQNPNVSIMQRINCHQR